MSTVILSAVAPISGVNADTNSDIAKQDATISSAQSAQAQAQKQVDNIQSKIGSIQAKQADLKNKMEKLKVEGKNSMPKFPRYAKILTNVILRYKLKHVAHK